MARDVCSGRIFFFHIPSGYTVLQLFFRHHLIQFIIRIYIKNTVFESVDHNVWITFISTYRSSYASHTSTEYCGSMQEGARSV